MVWHYQNAHCSLKNNFIVLFIIIFGTISFPVYLGVSIKLRLVTDTDRQTRMTIAHTALKWSVSPRVRFSRNAVSKYVSNKCISVRKVATPLREHTCQPHGITQCYLPPGRSDIPALTPAEAGTRLSDPGGMQDWVNLVGLVHTEMVYPPEDGHPSRY